MNILDALKQLRDDIKIWVTNNINILNQKIESKVNASDLHGIVDDAIAQAKESGELGGSQSDWTQTDDSQLDFIKNKPTLGILASKDTIGMSDLSAMLQEVLDKASKAPTIVTRNINLLAADWIEDEGLFSQVISIAEVTPTSRIDLYPTLEQTINLQSNGIALTVINENSVVTAYAINGKPTVDYDMQIVITDAMMVDVVSAEGVSF